MPNEDRDAHRAKRARMLSGIESNYLANHTYSDSDDADEHAHIRGTNVVLAREDGGEEAEEVVEEEEFNSDDDESEEGVTEETITQNLPLVLGKGTVKIHFSQGHDPDVSRYLELSSLNEAGAELGCLIGRIIDPQLIPQGDWYIALDGASKECSELGFNIFDENGRLKSMWCEGALRGSGVWTHDPGDINWDRNDGRTWSKLLVLETVEVAPRHRRRGLGRHMVELALMLGTGGATRFVFTRPIRPGPSPDASTPATLASLAFYRAMGFRRVGASHWFCYALDPVHASRGLAIEDDFGPVEGQVPVPVDTREALMAHMFGRGLS